MEGWSSKEGGFFDRAYLGETKVKVSEERSRAEAEFALRALGLEAGDAILDVPCGHGRHSIAFAELGLSVTGYDLNRTFLEEARRQASGKGLDIAFRHGDMRRLDEPPSFDGAVNLFTSLGYFASEAEDLQVLSGIYRALKPQGRFLVEMMNRDWMAANFSAREWQEKSCSGFTLRERRFDAVEGRILERRVILNGDVRKVDESVVRLYTPSELIRIATEAGFRVLESFGGFDGQELTISSPRMILLFEA